VLESWKKVENSVLSMAAVGLTVDAEASSDAAAACTTAAALLDALFPAVLAALRAGHDEVAAAAVPFLLSYVGRLKSMQKRAPDGVLPAGQAAHVPAILESLAACARFPDDSAAYEVVAACATERCVGPLPACWASLLLVACPADRCQPEQWLPASLSFPPLLCPTCTCLCRVAAEEEESAMADRRQDLFTLFRNAASLARPETYSFVDGRLSAALSGAAGAGAGAPWQDVELAVSLLYQLGEGAPEADIKPGSGVLAQLAAGIMQVSLASLPAS
jgi:exportin-T